MSRPGGFSEGVQAKGELSKCDSSGKLGSENWGQIPINSQSEISNAGGVTGGMSDLKEPTYGYRVVGLLKTIERSGNL